MLDLVGDLAHLINPLDSDNFVLHAWNKFFILLLICLIVLLVDCACFIFPYATITISTIGLFQYRLYSAFMSWGCPDKLPQIGWFKTTNLFSLSVLESRNLKSTCQLCSSRGSGRELIPCLLMPTCSPWFVAVSL